MSEMFTIDLAVILKKEPFVLKSANSTYKATVLLKNGRKSTSLLKHIDFEEIVREFYSACVANHIGLPVPSQFLAFDSSENKTYYGCEFVEYPNFAAFFTNLDSNHVVLREAYLKLKSWTGWDTTVAFDELIINIDRHLGNLLWNGKNHFILIDHGRTFGEPKSLPRCNRLMDLYKYILEPSLEELEKAIRGCQKKSSVFEKNLSKETLGEFSSLTGNASLDILLYNECRKLSTILEENLGKLPCLLSDHLPENDTLFAKP